MVFNSPKGFWRSLPEISLLLFSFVNPNHLKIWLPNHWCLFHFQFACIATSSQTFPQFIRPMSLLCYMGKTKTDCVLKYYLESNDQQRIECNASFFEVLGAIGTRSFGKSCKWIHKSQLGSWRSSSGQLFDLISATNQRSNKWTKSRTDSRTNQTNGFGCCASKQPLTHQQCCAL